jgi:hypothetical protein
VILSKIFYLSEPQFFHPLKRCNKQVLIFVKIRCDGMCLVHIIPKYRQDQMNKHSTYVMEFSFSSSHILAFHVSGYLCDTLEKIVLLALPMALL